MKPADAEAWDKHMRLERELLAQRRDGKLAKAVGKALPGESPQDLEQMAREDRSRAEEGLVSLLWGGQLSYKHVDKLTPENLLANRMLRPERSSKRQSVGRSHGWTPGSPRWWEGFPHRRTWRSFGWTSLRTRCGTKASSGGGLLPRSAPPRRAYSPGCLEGVFSETLTAPVLLPRLYEGAPFRPARRVLEGILVAVLGELGAMWPKVPVCGTLVVRSLVPVLGEREREDGHQVMGCIPIATLRWSQVTWAL